MLACPRCGSAQQPPYRPTCQKCGAPLAGGLPFRFPSGQTARSLEEFVEGCEVAWDEAVSLLQAGAFESFFQALKRPDLAAETTALRHAATNPDTAHHAPVDPGESLDILLRTISPTLPPPRLAVDRSGLDFGAVSRGSSARTTLRVTNHGNGYLTGAVEAAAPLATPVEAFGCGPGQTVEIAVVLSATGLSEGEATFPQGLRIATNGGDAVLGARAEIVIRARLELGTERLYLDLLDAPEGDADAVLILTNAGNVPMTVRIATDQPWLRVTPSFHHLEEGQRGKVDVHVEGHAMTGGPHQGALTFTSPAGEQVCRVEVDRRPAWPVEGGTLAQTRAFGVPPRRSLLGKLRLGHAWATPTDGPVSAAPVVVGGRLFAGTAAGTLYALDTRRGQEVWQYHTEAPIYAGPVVSAGLVVCASADGIVYALDGNTGALRWSYFWGPGPAPVLIAHGGSLHALGASPRHIDLETGLDAPGDLPTELLHPRVRGMSYRVTPTALEAHDLTHKTLVWSNTAWGSAGPRRIHWLGVTDTSVLLLWGEQEQGPSQNLTLLGRKTGIEGTGRRLTPPATASGAAVAEGVIYLGCETHLVALSGPHAQPVWHAEVDSPIYVPPAVVDGMVFVACQSGQIHAFR